MKSSKESQRLKKVSSWYTSEGFYAHLVELGFRSVKPYFQKGPALEMGCADGEMTQYLVKHFKHLEVIDGSAEYVKVTCKKVPQVKAGHTSLFEDFVPPRKYKTIIAAHILEHLKDPVATLKQVRSWLAPGGRLLVIVPNALSFHRLLGVKLRMIAKPTSLNERDKKLGHRRVYTPETLAADIKRGGWHVKAFGGNFFKILSNAQMESFDPKIVEGFYELGKDFPEHCSELYAVCTLKR